MEQAWLDDHHHAGASPPAPVNMGDLMATKVLVIWHKHSPAAGMFVPHSGQALYCRMCRIKDYKWIAGKEVANEST